jgi:hypothetical protein
MYSFIYSPKDSNAGVSGVSLFAVWCKPVLHPINSEPYTIDVIQLGGSLWPLPQVVSQ